MKIPDDEWAQMHVDALNRGVRENEKRRLAYEKKKAFETRWGVGVLGSFNRFMTVVAVVICTVMWAVVGFLVWVPCLTRMMMIFVGAVMMSVFSNRDTSKAERGLEQAIGLYALGFRKMLNPLNAPEHRGDVGSAGGMTMGDFARGFTEIVFAAIFWILLVIGWTLWFGYGWSKVTQLSRPAVAATVQPESRPVVATVQQPSPLREVAPPPGTVRPPTPNMSATADVKPYDLPVARLSTDVWLRGSQLSFCGENWEACKRNSPLIYQEWCEDTASIGLRKQAMCPVAANVVDRRTLNLRTWCEKYPVDCRKQEPVVWAAWCKSLPSWSGPPSGLTCP